MPETAEMVNPLREGIRLRRTPDPCAIVIFGASGDLTQRKLIPALFDQAVEQHLRSRFSIIGCGQTPLSDDAFRERMHGSVRRFSRHRPEGPAWPRFAASLFYLTNGD